MLLIEVPAFQTSSAKTVLMYGHLDKQPEMVGWREATGRGCRASPRASSGRGGADDGAAVFSSLAALRRAARGKAVACARRGPHRMLRGKPGHADLPAYLNALEPGLAFRIWSSASIPAAATTSNSQGTTSAGPYQRRAHGRGADRGRASGGRRRGRLELPDRARAPGAHRRRRHGHGQALGLPPRFRPSAPRGRARRRSARRRALAQDFPSSPACSRCRPIWRISCSTVPGGRSSASPAPTACRRPRAPATCSRPGTEPVLSFVRADGERGHRAPAQRRSSRPIRPTARASASTPAIAQPVLFPETSTWLSGAARSGVDEALRKGRDVDERGRDPLHGDARHSIRELSSSSPACSARTPTPRPQRVPAPGLRQAPHRLRRRRTGRSRGASLGVLYVWTQKKRRRA